MRRKISWRQPLFGWLWVGLTLPVVIWAFGQTLFYGLFILSQALTITTMVLSSSLNPNREDEPYWQHFLIRLLTGAGLVFLLLYFARTS